MITKQTVINKRIMRGFSTNINFARELDLNDILKRYREQFIIDDQDLIYLDGNSLGRLPKKSFDNLKHTINIEWGRDLISSWNKTWINKPAELGNKIVREKSYKNFSLRKDKVT